MKKRYTGRPQGPSSLGNRKQMLSSRALQPHCSLLCSVIAEVQVPVQTAQSSGCSGMSSRSAGFYHMLSP